MKTSEQVKPNYAPVYAAALYPGLARVFVDHGYALAVHGSLARDFDLIAVPWAEKLSPPETVLTEVTTRFAVELIGGPTAKNHGRTAYTLSVGFGECALDLSFLGVADVVHETERKRRDRCPACRGRPKELLKGRGRADDVPTTCLTCGAKARKKA